MTINAKDYVTRKKQIERRIAQIAVAYAESIDVANDAEDRAGWTEECERRVDNLASYMTTATLIAETVADAVAEAIEDADVSSFN